MSQNVIAVLVGQSLALIGGMFGFYVFVKVKLRELELRITMMEDNENEVLKKLDRLQDDINEIKIELQNKQNRS